MQKVILDIEQTKKLFSKAAKQVLNMSCEPQAVTFPERDLWSTAEVAHQGLGITKLNYTRLITQHLEFLSQGKVQVGITKKGGYPRRSYGDMDMDQIRALPAEVPSKLLGIEVTLSGPDADTDKLVTKLKKNGIKVKPEGSTLG